MTDSSFILGTLTSFLIPEGKKADYITFFEDAAAYFLENVNYCSLYLRPLVNLLFLCLKKDY
jgi:hypothetical protein